MPRNIMAALNTVPNGKAPKNPFDLMNFETFHQKGGQLNVVGVRETMPNADYRMSVDAFTRTQLCNTANFARMKENWYFVHVPLGLISANAYQMLVQRKQPYSARDFGITQFPYFSLKAVLKRCLEIAHLDLSLPANAKFRDVHGFNIGLGAFKLLDMLGYGCYLDIVESTFKESQALSVDQAKAIFNNIPYSPNALALGAYQMIWYYFFRNEIYDNDVTAKIFNFDDVTAAAPGSEPLSNYDILAIRDIDDFIIDCLQLRYVPYKNDIFMGAMPGTQYGAVSTVPVDVEFSDLSAAFIGNTVTPTGSFVGSPGTVNVGDVAGSVRRTSFDMYDADGNVALPLTTDDENKHTLVRDSGLPIDPSDFPVGSNDYPYVRPAIDNGQLTNNGTPRIGLIMSDNQGTPTDIDKDLSLNVRDLHTHYLNGHSHAITPGSFVPQGSISINSITPTGSVSLSGGIVSSSLFDVLQLVEAQAIQKWRQKSMLAGNKTADQFRAHHGEVPRHLIDHIPDFIGSVDNPIQVTEITSNADTATAADESNLGEIRGRGYGASDNKVFNFHSDDYGLLFLLHAIVPENTYSSFGLDKRNTKLYYTDFYQEEYMNIGLESLPNYQLNITDLLGNDPYPWPGHHGEGGDTFPRSGVGIRGYVPRYYEYKQYPSKVHGMFNPSRLTIYGLPYDDVFGYSDMQSFVMPRADLVVPLNNELSFNWLVWTLSKLYVNPSLFDSIFAENADSHELTDNFFSHVKFNCDSLQPVSVLGLPQF